MTQEWKTLSELAEGRGLPFEAELEGGSIVRVIGTRSCGTFVCEEIKNKCLLQYTIGCSYRWRLVPPAPVKPREWWLRLNPIDKSVEATWNAAPTPCHPKYDKFVHVREVLPNSVSVTREDLKKAVETAKSTAMQSDTLAEARVVYVDALASALGLGDPK